MVHLMLYNHIPVTEWMLGMENIVVAHTLMYTVEFWYGYYNAEQMMITTTTMRISVESLVKLS